MPSLHNVRKRTSPATEIWEKSVQQPIQDENYYFNFYPPLSASSITCFGPIKVSQSVPSDIVIEGGIKCKYKELGACD
jgi:hypothetical protein